jgi:hypothetical protein
MPASALPVAPGAAEAAQAHCGFLLPCLRVLAEQLRACGQQVDALLRTMADEPGEGDRPSDMAIVLSLPGVGRKITAWLFAEAAQPSPSETLRCYARIADLSPSRSKAASAAWW